MTVRKEAAQIILPRLLFLALNFAQPFLLFRVTAAVKHDEDSDTAHGLIGATALIFGGIAVRLPCLPSPRRSEPPRTDHAAGNSRFV